MDPIQTATSMLTATTLVFAGSSFLIGQLQERAAEALEDEYSTEYEDAAYFATSLGFGFMILTTAILVGVMTPDFGLIQGLELPDSYLIGVAGYTFLASIASPSVAAVIICQDLYRENREPLQLNLLSDRFDR